MSKVLVLYYSSYGSRANKGIGCHRAYSPAYDVGRPSASSETPSLNGTGSPCPR